MLTKEGQNPWKSQVSEAAKAWAAIWEVLRTIFLKGSRESFCKSHRGQERKTKDWCLLFEKKSSVWLYFIVSYFPAAEPSVTSLCSWLWLVESSSGPPMYHLPPPRPCTPAILACFYHSNIHQGLPHHILPPTIPLVNSSTSFCSQLEHCFGRKTFINTQTSLPPPQHHLPPLVTLTSCATSVFPGRLLTPRLFSTLRYPTPNTLGMFVGGMNSWMKKR